LILVDAHGLIYQHYHGTKNQGLSTASAVPTNALFGFTRDLLYLRSLKPAVLIVTYDLSEKTFRNDLYPDYKAHRDPMPDDLSIQLPLIHQSMEALSIPALGLKNYEADDLLATLSRAGAAHGYDVWICTSDKDCRQLITDRIRLYNLRKREEFGRANLLEDWGVTPEQVVDLQILVGDSVDNVPGVPGVGVKTAAKLLQQYGTLDNLIAHLDEVPGKKQESIRTSTPLFETSRRLVRLADDVPVKINWETWKLQPIKTELATKMFQEWGFSSLVRQLRDGTVETRRDEPGLFDGAELFPFGANAPANGEKIDNEPKKDDWKAVYHLVDTPEEFERFFGLLNVQKRFAVDLETTGLEPLRCDLVGLSFSWKEGEAYYLPVRAPICEPHLDVKHTLGRLKPLFENPNVEKVNQNIKYDMLVLRAHGIKLAGIAGDSMVADYLLYPGERSHSKEELSRRHLHHEVIPIEDLIGKKTRKAEQLSIDQVSTQQVKEYAAQDADVALRLCNTIEPQLESVSREPGVASLRKLYQEVEVPLIEVLASMEFYGIRLDVPLLRKLSAEMAKQLDEIEEEIYRLAGRRFKIGSLPQLRTILFDELKLPKQKMTDTTGEAKTDQQTLEKLAEMTHLPGHKLPQKILEQRQLSKLKSTYVDALPELVNPNTGRIHASFNQTVAVTGRLSSSDPNLQNIPIRREMGQQIRQAFLPEPGWRLLTADYSQIELRLLAHFCGDDALRKAFAEDRDIHTAVAAEINGVSEDRVTADMRRVAKTVNFGVLYGMSAHGLAERLHISRNEAAKFIDSYFTRYPRVLEYQQRLLAHCRKSGYVPTILGRRRKIDGIRGSTTYQQRNQPEREAINMEIQGSAADLIKLAMLNLYRRLQRERLRSRLLLQIHDELVFESPPEELHRLAGIVREEMTTPLEKSLRLQAPLKVDMREGPNWLDTTSLEEAAA
jgi:DNA polymerase-1